jgi:hypothetical protein
MAEKGENGAGNRQIATIYRNFPPRGVPGRQLLVKV